MTHVRFEPYAPACNAACLALFDRNCPAFFAPRERSDYADFLTTVDGSYQVVLADEAVIAAFGVALVAPQRARLRWIVIDPAWQGRGIGRAMMDAATEAARALGATALEIAASHKSAPFFARFGAQTVAFVRDGWGADMHRVDMQLPVDAERA
jgi:GNAT superfamily N-acetyltransferase